MSDYCIKLNSENPIAVVCGGEYDEKKVSVVQSKDTDVNRDPLEQLDISEFIQSYKLMDIDERMDIINEIKGNKLLQKKNIPFKKKFEDSCRKTFHIDSGQFNILPSEKSERIFIAGSSGSGKSTLASMYILEYKLMFPKNKIFLFSTHDGEKAYQIHKGIIQIKLNNEILNENITLKDLQNSLCIFDDADNLQSKSIQHYINQLNSDLIANGRKYNIHVLTLCHQLMDYSKTRLLLIEANKVIFFLHNGKYHIQRYLKVYAGLDQNQIRQIMRLKSRWVCLNTGFPNYYISQHEIALI